MDDAPNRWTLEGFVQHFDFVHHMMPDHKYVWVLGAGASKASGIPLGSELVDRWLGELFLREGVRTMTLEQWATAKALGIDDFEYEARASFYPKIYQRRFLDYADEGYAYLESVMSGKDPSPGYSILAAALAGKADSSPRHNAVVTTNFDNLVADALSIYTDVFPFVCGHESLTGFVRVAMRRPLICKIHRDLVLAPQNDPRSLRRLHDAWGTALRALFQSYTPLVIGYGGNDDTLMDLLESLQPGDIKGQLVWCYYEGGQPGERIVNLVADLKGILVPVPDFDLLMVLLGEKMNIQLLDQEIGRRAHERTERYRERIQRLDTVRHPNVARALAATLDRSGGWWAWHRKAEMEKDPKRREIVYRQAIQNCPKDASLHSVFADFLARPRGDHAEADRLHRKAIELDSKDPFLWARYAGFLAYVQRDLDQAEKHYRKAVEIDPKNPYVIASFADFLTRWRSDVEEAERVYRKAIELGPDIADLSARFAAFLSRYLGANEEADRYYRRAFELAPTDALVIARHAAFQAYTRGNYNEASQLFQKVLDLHPEDANILREVANFRSIVLGDYTGAELLLRSAVERNPEDDRLLAAVADFLIRRGHSDKAEPLIRTVLDVEPGNPLLNFMMAVCLEKLRGDYKGAQRFYRKALELDPYDADIARTYADFLSYVRENDAEAERLYKKALETRPRDVDHMAAFAEWLMARKRFDEARAMVERLDSVMVNRSSSNNAELILYRSYLARVEGEDDLPGIEALRALLAVGFPRPFMAWDPNPGMRCALEHLSAEDRPLYLALIEAIREPENVPDIDALLRDRSAAIATRDGRHTGKARAASNGAPRTSRSCESRGRGAGGASRPDSKRRGRSTGADRR